MIGDEALVPPKTIQPVPTRYVSYTATPVFGSATAETSGALVRRGPAGRLGRRGLGYLLLFQTLLPLLGPVVDVFVVYGLVFLQPARVIAVWLGFLLLQLTMGWYAFRLDGERTGPLWSLPLQQFVYRQLMYLVVVQSVFTALAGSRLPWQRMERYGSLQAPPSPTALADAWLAEAHAAHAKGASMSADSYNAHSPGPYGDPGQS